jgi:hypothetical protein
MTMAEKQNSEFKRKVPHPYSRAEESARSWTGFGMTSVWNGRAAFMKFVAEPMHRSLGCAVAFAPAPLGMTKGFVAEPMHRSLGCAVAFAPAPLGMTKGLVTEGGVAEDECGRSSKV